MNPTSLRADRVGAGARMPGGVLVLALPFFLASALAPVAAAVEPVSLSLTGDKPTIEKRDDLPRHTYPISTTATELVQSKEALAPLAAEARKNITSDLESYDIKDKTTLKQLHNMLVILDVIDNDYDSALKHIETIRGLEDKEAQKLTTGLATEARAHAFREAGTDDMEAFRKAFQSHYAEKVAALPYDVVQDVLQGTKGHLEMMSANLILGVVKEQLEPVIERAEGEVSGDIAEQIIGTYFALNVVIPTKDEVVAVLQDVIDSNKVEKEDIWAARDVDLNGRNDLSPVMVAIWDTGVDPQVFEDRMFTNPKEVRDGTDTDGNGHVDDIHGVAYDMHWKHSSGELYDMDEATRPVADLQADFKGFFDLQAAVDSPEAQALKQKMSKLQQDEAKPFLEDLMRYTMYSHGTHVAGIATAGNPAASVLIARLEGEVTMIPEAPTMEDSRRAANAYKDIIDYYKQHGVRVVNMSWVVPLSSFETALEQNGIGEGTEERKQMAREMFEVGRQSMYEAMKNAPDILFVGGAGNSNNDITFDEFYPPMFELPNLLIAGAVDQAGEPTGFTSFGPSVNIYSNGFEVDSYVPGGDRMKLSGTSMASPNVANLAAKLFALDPDLQPADARKLIIDGADEVKEGDQVLRIMNPKRSVELLKRRGAEASM